nr:hemolysin family protein [Anaerolineaceae bacterium]
EMVDGVFRLTERRIDALMTPHTELEWINLEDEPEEIIRDIKASPYSRMPVAEGDLDRTIGMLHIKDLVGIDIYAPDFSVTNHIREALFLPGNMQAVKAFESFREKAVHQALVMDEFGGVLGLVTLYDVLESIVGAIPLNEFDLNQEVVLRPDGSWSFDGLLPIDVLKDLLKVEQFPEEDTADFQTLSGFIMNQLGRIPKVGQSFIWEQFSFEVLDMDGFRVDRVLVTDLSKQHEEAETAEGED